MRSISSACSWQALPSGRLTPLHYFAKVSRYVLPIRVVLTINSSFVNRHNKALALAFGYESKRLPFEVLGGSFRPIELKSETDLLDRARKSTGERITGTIRRGLELVASAEAQRELAALRGKVKFTL